jgi:hypothetical protein
MAQKSMPSQVPACLPADQRPALRYFSTMSSIRPAMMIMD